MVSSSRLHPPLGGRWVLLSWLILGMSCWTVLGSPPARCPECAPCDAPRCVKVPASKTETRTTYCTKVEMRCISNPCGRMWAWLCGKPASCKDSLEPIAVKKMIKKQTREQVPSEECKLVGP